MSIFHFILIQIRIIRRSQITTVAKKFEWPVEQIIRISFELFAEEKETFKFYILLFTQATLVWTTLFKGNTFFHMKYFFDIFHISRNH